MPDTHQTPDRETIIEPDEMDPPRSPISFPSISPLNSENFLNADRITSITSIFSMSSFAFGDEIAGISCPDQFSHSILDGPRMSSVQNIGSVEEILSSEIEETARCSGSLGEPKQNINTPLLSPKNAFRKNDMPFCKSGSRERQNIREGTKKGVEIPKKKSKNKTVLKNSTEQVLIRKKLPLKGIRKPGQFDVICGRGGGANKNEGNIRYRDLVKIVQPKYLLSSKANKPKVALGIVKTIRSYDHPGRFLEKNRETGLWDDVGDKKAQAKTSQALREEAPVIRAQLKKEMPGVRLSGAVKRGRLKKDFQDISISNNLNEIKTVPNGKTQTSFSNSKNAVFNLALQDITQEEEIKNKAPPQYGVFSAPDQQEHKKTPISTFFPKRTVFDQQAPLVPPMHKHSQSKTNTEYMKVQKEDVDSQPRSRIFQVDTKKDPIILESPNLHKQKKLKKPLPLSEVLRRSFKSSTENMGYHQNSRKAPKPFNIVSANESSAHMDTIDIFPVFPETNNIRKADIDTMSATDLLRGLSIEYVPINSDESLCDIHMETFNSLTTPLEAEKPEPDELKEVLKSFQQEDAGAYI